MFAVNDHHQDDSNAEYLRRLVSHVKERNANCFWDVSFFFVVEKLVSSNPESRIHSCIHHTLPTTAKKIVVAIYYFKLLLLLSKLVLSTIVCLKKSSTRNIFFFYPKKIRNHQRMLPFVIHTCHTSSL